MSLRPQSGAGGVGPGASRDSQSLHSPCCPLGAGPVSWPGTRVWTQDPPLLAQAVGGPSSCAPQDHTGGAANRRHSQLQGGFSADLPHVHSCSPLSRLSPTPTTWIPRTALPAPDPGPRCRPCLPAQRPPVHAAAAARTRGCGSAPSAASSPWPGRSLPSPQHSASPPRTCPGAPPPGEYSISSCFTDLCPAQRPFQS